MKILFPLLILSCISAHGQNALNDRIKNAGIIAELANLKLTSEAWIKKIVDEKALSQTQKDKCISLYNHVRSLTDQFILQLLADLAIHNKPRRFKILNQYFIDHTLEELKADNTDAKDLVERYINQIKQIFDASRKLYGCISSDAAFADIPIVDLLTLGKDLWKDIVEINAGKIEKVSKILDALRLSALDDITSKKENEKK